MSKPQTALIHPTGSPFTHHAALALAELGLLHEIVTTIAHRPAGSLEHAINLLPARMRQPLTRELRRRTWFSDIDANVQRHLWREVVRLTIVKSGLSPSLGFGATGPINWVYTALDQHVAHHHLHQIEAVYAYEDGAATTFARAKERSLFCFYDLPIMYYRLAQSIQAEEAARFPHLSSALQAVHEPDWKLARKEQEIALADHIFVASSITKRSLLEAGVPADKITVIPYGAPVDYFQPMSNQDHTAFRALFVGRVGPRKGVHYLLQAWQTLKLPNATLQLIGVNEFPKAGLEQNDETITYLPPVPHATLGDYYNRANVFVFPSLVEGFGLVLLEAMACGLPVITTPNTAGPDIITDGVEGFIIPIRDVEALKEKLEWCYRHPQELAEMGRAARRRAEQLTWDLYRRRLGSRVKEVYDHHCSSKAKSCMPIQI